MTEVWTTFKDRPVILTSTRAKGWKMLIECVKMITFTSPRFKKFLHGGPKFGPLPPPSRDSICMPSQVWSTNLLFEIFDHVINSRRIRRFGPYSNSSNTQVWSSSNRKNGPNLRIRTDWMPRDHKLFEFAGLVHFFCSKWTKPAYSKSLNMDQTCVFEEN